MWVGAGRIVTLDPCKDSDLLLYLWLGQTMSEYRGKPQKVSVIMLFETINTEFGETEDTKLRSWGEALKNVESGIWLPGATYTTFKHHRGMWITRFTRPDDTSTYSFSYVGDSRWNHEDNPLVQLETIDMESFWHTAKFSPKYKKMRLVSLLANAHLKDVKTMKEVKVIYNWLAKKVREISNG